MRVQVGEHTAVIIGSGVAGQRVLSNWLDHSTRDSSIVFFLAGAFVGWLAWQALVTVGAIVWAVVSLRAREPQQQGQHSR